MTKSSPRRRKKTHYPLQGTTLRQWQADSNLVKWAQEEPNFRLALTVLINERISGFQDKVPPSEARMLGRVEGFEKAIAFFNELQKTKFENPSNDEEVTYGGE